MIYHQKGDSVALTDTWAEYSDCISVAEGETAMFGVQLADTTAYAKTEIKDFKVTLLEAGDANFDLSVNICDLLRIKKYINDNATKISMAGNMNTDDVLDAADISAIRNKILNPTI